MVVLYRKNNKSRQMLEKEINKMGKIKCKNISERSCGTERVERGKREGEGMRERQRKR